MRIEIVAPDGIGEVTPDTDLVGEILRVLAPETLRDGDIVVVTSKVLSKQAGRITDDHEQALTDETIDVVAARPGVRIVRNRLGIVQAAAGIDRSNSRDILLLPLDPDADARALQADLHSRTGARVGVIVSDTAGRAWRTGQTDHAIGIAGVLPVDDHAGRVDVWGNELAVTAIAVADELAAAADLAKTKLGGRPVAVIRGRADLVTDAPHAAAELQRPVASDLFARGPREGVLAACLAAVGHPEEYDRLVLLPHDEACAEVLRWAAPAHREVLQRILTAY